MRKGSNSAFFFACSLIEQIGRILHARGGDAAATLEEKRCSGHLVLRPHRESSR